MIKIKALKYRQLNNDEYEFYGIMDIMELSLINDVSIQPTHNTQLFYTRYNKKRDNLIEFKQRGYFFSPPIKTTKSFICPVFSEKTFYVYKGKIMNKQLYLQNNFRVFVNCFHYTKCFHQNNSKSDNVNTQIHIFLPNNFIGKILVLKRLTWIIDQVFLFTKDYLKNDLVNPKVVNFVVCLFKNNKEEEEKEKEKDFKTSTSYPSNNRIILLNLDYFPFPEKKYKGFKTNLRDLFAKFLLFVFRINKFEENELLRGFTNLLSLYVEFLTFKNPNELLYLIYNSYKNNRNKMSCLFFWILNHITRNNSQLFSLYYLNLLKIFIVKPFNLLSITNKIKDLFNVDLINTHIIRDYFDNDYPILEINVEEVKQDHVFYLKIRIQRIQRIQGIQRIQRINNDSYGKYDNYGIIEKQFVTTTTPLECRIYERTGINKVYLNLLKNNQTNLYIYNCRGRLNKIRKNCNTRKTEIPDKIFNYVEFNYNGKLPCYLIIKENNVQTNVQTNVQSNIQKMINECCFWTKLVCLDNLIGRKSKPDLLQIHDLVKDVCFLNLNNDGYSKLVKLLCLFLFNENTYMKFINYKLKFVGFYTNPKMINLAIGIYKYLFKVKNKDIYSPIKINNLYNPVSYNLRKSLLKQISLCHIKQEEEKILIFFKEVVEDFSSNSKKNSDFYHCLFECISNLGFVEKKCFERFFLSIKMLKSF